MLTSCGVEELIARIQRDGRHRVLRRVDLRTGPTGVEPEGGVAWTGVALDVETTGVDPGADAIIELGMRRFRYDDAGRILEIGRPRSWLEDPGRALEAGVVALTGLTDEDLAGERIDDREALKVLGSARVVVAHNAGFDRPFVERRLPAARGLAWACSMTDVDWADRGFQGRALGHLLLQTGWFHDGHRAGADVDAVIQLLRLGLPEGWPALQELLETAARPTFRVEACGAAFAVKDVLHRRGYRWNARAKVWWREVGDCDLDDEESWLAREVYRADKGCRALAPRLTPVTWRERYA